MWLYNSPIGPIYIKRLQDGNYGMIYDNVIWEACDTPQIAADNVYMQVTGCDTWDDYDSSDIEVPTSLHEWNKI